MRNKHAAWFLDPVDPVAMGIEHYPEIIKRPMDFGTIKATYRDPASETHHERSQRRRGRDADRSRTDRGDAAAKTWMVRGDGVGRRYKAGGYADAAAFAADCRLVFANAMTFNKETDEPVHVAAKWLATKFEERYGDAIADALDLDSSDDEAE